LKILLVLITTAINHPALRGVRGCALGLPVNFELNLNLQDMAMKACHSKVLNVKPPRGL
jgi:hypothetical protein